MSEKEATIYIIDVGKSTGEKRHGREITDLHWSMKYVWDKLATQVGTGRKTLCSAVVAFRSDETKNDLEGEDAYANINVLQPLGQVLMPYLRTLRKEIRPSKTNDGDALSALIIAIQLMEAFTKKLKYIRRIILVTQGSNYMDAGDVDEIVNKIKEDNIELIILGADFDSAEYGYKEEDKDAQKAQNETILQDLAYKCGGICGSLNQAIAELDIPRIKSTRPVPSYKGYLTLGDPSSYDSAMSIDVERYPRTMVAKAPTASTFAVKADMAEGDAAAGPSDAPDIGEAAAPDGGLTVVHQARTYQVKDESAPGGKKDVERDDLAKGYEYGRTAVYISESDLNITKLDTKAGLEIVGFIPAESHDHYIGLDRSNIVIAQRTNEKAIMALSSFIHALYELESYAVARLVTKDMKDPSLVLLAPSIEPDYECLVEVELPFAEDVRPYKFPPLDRVVTISGKVLTEHRNLPSKDLQSAMDDFVDNMDISSFGKDDEGNDMEYMPMEDTFSPVLHRLSQAIRFRAVHSVDAVPPPSEILTKFSNPPQELAEKASKYLDRVRNAADVKRVPPKSLSRKRYRGSRLEEKPRSGLDVSALLSTRSSAQEKQISPDNAIPEFRQMLDTAEDVDSIGRAVKQLSTIIENWIKHSLGDSAYDKAVEAIGVMRKECIEMEEPGLYNDAMKNLKGKIVGEELGGERGEMWWKIRSNKLGLIDNKISPVSEVDEEEAKAFLAAK